MIVPPQLQPLGLPNMPAHPLQPLPEWVPQQAMPHPLAYPLAHSPAYPTYPCEPAYYGTENMPPHSSAYPDYQYGGANSGMEGPAKLWQNPAGSQQKPGGKEGNGRQRNEGGKDGDMREQRLGIEGSAGNPEVGGSRQGSGRGGGRQESLNRMQSDDAGCDSAREGAPRILPGPCGGYRGKMP